MLYVNMEVSSECHTKDPKKGPIIVLSSLSLFKIQNQETSNIDCFVSVAFLFPATNYDEELLIPYITTLVCFTFWLPSVRGSIFNHEWFIRIIISDDDRDNSRFIWVALCYNNNFYC